MKFSFVLPRLKGLFKNERHITQAHPPLTCRRSKARGILKEGNVSRLLTMQEAAGVLRVSRRTLERYIKDGLLHKYKIGGKCLVEQIELDRFVKRNRAS